MPTIPRLWANWFARRSSALVALLAVAGLSISIFILFWPAAGAELADRANISSAVATLFALFAAIVAISAAVWVTTSDYKAEQAVKADTARIRAALRSIMIKGVLLSQKGPGTSTTLDFEVERETLNKFLSSTTAYGYWWWVRQRGEAAAVGTDEPWRVFFLSIASLLDACASPGNGVDMIRWAVDLEKLFEKLDRGDVDEITRHVADLAGALGTATTSKDALLSSIHTVFGTADTDQDVTRRMFLHLKKKGVVDPNVDLFVAVFGDDADAVKAALEGGADTSVTDKQVLAAHRAELADFDPEQRM